MKKNGWKPRWPRVRHFAVDTLSAAGRAVVAQGARENWTIQRTLAELAAGTGEEVSPSAVHRWRHSQRLAQLGFQTDTQTPTLTTVFLELRELRCAIAELASLIGSRELDVERLEAITQRQGKILATLSKVAGVFFAPHVRPSSH